MRTFEAAAFRLFRGWDRVSVAYDELKQQYMVRLALKAEWMVEDQDLESIQERLFRGTEAWRAVEMVKKQRKRLGLRHYGRKRRG